MAGLYDRVTADDATKISIHLLTGATKAYVAGESRATILAEINASLDDLPLVGDELTDFNNMGDNIDALATIQDRVLYVFTVEYIMLAAENGLVGETAWRTRLGL